MYDTENSEPCQRFADNISALNRRCSVSGLSQSCLIHRRDASASRKSVPYEREPEVCGVGAVFPGSPGYRPAMKGSLPYNSGTHPLRGKASPTSGNPGLRRRGGFSRLAGIPPRDDGESAVQRRDASASRKSVPYEWEPEGCTVGAVFPGLPGYRPAMWESCRTTAGRIRCAEKRPLRAGNRRLAP